MYICCHSTGEINAIVQTVANYGEREKGMVLFLFQILIWVSELVKHYINKSDLANIKISCVYSQYKILIRQVHLCKSGFLFLFFLTPNFANLTAYWILDIHVVLKYLFLDPQVGMGKREKVKIELIRRESYKKNWHKNI